MAEPTPEGLSILRHAIGMSDDGRKRGGWRNNYLVEVGSPDEAIILGLVAKGLMEPRPVVAVVPGRYYVVTEAGKRLCEERTPPPRRTRSQLRMERFRSLSDVCSITFREFLHLEADEARRAREGAQP